MGGHRRWWSLGFGVLEVRDVITLSQSKLVTLMDGKSY